ncbi:hypothetical protein [Brevundimonas balnearis]|uniref:Uncharacterized protein n=1 Tax=Brevundimonas balnearis TaxID=1572858 RepID=A0ABV6R4P0_9CAUL
MGELIERSLAEGRWLWRRLFVFGVTFALWTLLADVVARAPVQDLRALGLNLMGLLALVLVLYLVAPTAQQLVELAANVRLRMLERGR